MTASASNNGSHFVETKKWRRGTLLAAITLFLSMSAYAQNELQNKEASETKERSLEYKLMTLTPTACIGTPLKLRLEVTNVGQETVKLNRAYLWSNSFEYSTVPEGEDKEREFSWTHVHARSTSEDIISLAPGKTYVTHRYWVLKEATIKTGAGNYTLDIGVGSKAQVELHDCGQKESKE